jgi:predicted TIM-barrel fold metal-dependent hydrolase
MKPQIVNCHTHLFNRAAVPAQFLPSWLLPLASLIAGKLSSKFLMEVLRRLQHHEVALLIEKFHAFLNIGSLHSQQEIFNYLKSFYPEGTAFCVLAMDMEFMGSGPVAQPYINQLDELAAIKADPAYSDLIHPFIFVHPERKGIFDLVQRYIEDKGFTGIKIYPPLGYYPFDERLSEVYAYAEKNQIPITTHCARGGIFYKGSITGQMLRHPRTGRIIPAQANKYFTDVYTDPDNYEWVLQEFPGLKINLAHFGGHEEWRKYLGYDLDGEGATWYGKILRLIKQYPGVYTDISYTAARPELMNLLKVTLGDFEVRQKVLFGSDFYMVEQETSERALLTDIRAGIGEFNFQQIATVNPMRFLQRQG